MSATAFQRRRRELAKQKAEIQLVDYTYEQLNAMNIPKIKALLDSKEIEYKSNDTKKELIAYLVEVPEEQHGSQDSGDTSNNDGDNNVDPD